VDGETKTGASLGVCLRESDTLGLEGSATGDGKLVAGHVVLGTTGGASSVKCDSLSTEEVVTRSDVLRNGEVKLSACSMLEMSPKTGGLVHTVVVEVLGTPEVVVTLSGIWVLSPGVLVNLEELAGTIGSGRVLNLGHVCEDWPPMSATDSLLLAVTGVVLVHLDGNCVTSLKVALSFSRSRANVA
jgi:hypothetical protein